MTEPMTPEQAMAEIAEWMEAGKHYWDAFTYIDDGWQLGSYPFAHTDARRYLTGYFQEWFVENEQAILDVVGPQKWLVITSRIPTKECLQYLWQAYKAVKGIEVKK